MRLVSPMTRPGRRPRASAGAWSTAARRPARSRSAALATVPGGDRTRGSPVTARVATRSSARSVGPSRPVTRTVARHGRSTSRVSPVRRTGAATARRVPRASTSMQRRLAQDAGAVTRAGEHDGVTGDDGVGGHDGPVVGQLDDAAAGPQDGVTRGGDLEEDDEEAEQERGPAPDGRRCRRRSTSSPTPTTSAHGGDDEVARGRQAERRAPTRPRRARPARAAAGRWSEDLRIGSGRARVPGRRVAGRAGRGVTASPAAGAAPSSSRRSH